ncbi:hypothetical protein B1812_08485 [Methylocystis bryophila]|uniref:Uncharacterized protein n=1 Tax=Methylocystis bryophila TaxID=655015 RepID=A0A1W6MU34_9HYPH|nr:hypothetical protein B1812_08485 [Methylocystis bryophila]
MATRTSRKGCNSDEGRFEIGDRSSRSSIVLARDQFEMPAFIAPPTGSSPESSFATFTKGASAPNLVT